MASHAPLRTRIFMGLTKAARAWTTIGTYSDPAFANRATGDANCRMAWYHRISAGHDMYLYGAEFWTFFDNLSG
jgi:glucan 1,3-beta-glucosidase